MIRFLGMAMFVTASLLVSGQTTGNPFDLKFRSPKSTTTIIPVSPKKGVVDSSGTSSSTEIIPSTGTGTKVIDSSHQIPSGHISDTTMLNSSSNPFELKDGPDAQKSASEPVIITPKAEAKDKAPAAPGERKTSKGFQIFFILLSLLLLIFIVNVERNFVRDLWKVISNENYSSLHHRNQRNTMRQILLVMGYTVFILQAGLFIYHTLGYFHIQGDYFGNIWTPTAIVLGIYLTRHGVIRYLRWLFNNDKEMTLFGFDISIFNTMVGLILLPINILVIFGPESIYKPLIIIGVIAILLAYLMRQLRWMLSARHLISNSLFLFFVYLCAVEILPLWAISKLFW